MNSNLLCRTLEQQITSCNSGRYSFLDNMDANSGANFMRSKQTILFKPPRIHKGKQKWYITYSVKVPAELRHKYPYRWTRMKVFEDINRIKTDDYAQLLCEAVHQALKNGYNPFKQKQIIQAEMKAGLHKNKVWTIQQALSYFKQSRQQRELEKASTVKYERISDLFLQWLTNREIQNVPASEINSSVIETFLTESKKVRNWSSTTFNKNRSFLSTAFIFLVSKRIIQSNPCTGTFKLKAVTRKHKYYDDRTLTALKNKLQEKDPYLYFVCQTVYYLCIRAEKELRNLRVKDIHPDRMQVFVNAGKTGDRYIPLSKEMLQMFEQRGVLNYDPDYYVFSVPHRNRFVPDGHPGPEPFGNGFFSKRFAKIRKEMKLDSSFTIYGFKHLRVIHLKTDGVSDANIMSLTGHSSYDAYFKYLRDLGMTANADQLQAASRKF